MTLPGWLESHRRSVLAATLVLALGGLVSLSSLPVGLFPATTFPRVLVSVDSGDRPAERMIVEVTRPIEEAVRGVPGVRNVRSTTSRGTCDVSIDFAWGTDMISATLEVDAAIVQIVSSLPQGTTFEARRMDPFAFPVLGLSLTSTANRSLVELRDRALYELAPRLSTVPGVARVGVQGGRSAELQVLLDVARLDAVDLTLEDVVRSISAANVVEAVGPPRAGRAPLPPARRHAGAERKGARRRDPALRRARRRAARGRRGDPGRHGARVDASHRGGHRGRAAERVPAARGKHRADRARRGAARRRVRARPAAPTCGSRPGTTRAS